MGTAGVTIGSISAIGLTPFASDEASVAAATTAVIAITILTTVLSVAYRCSLAIPHPEMMAAAAANVLDPAAFGGALALALSTVLSTARPEIGFFRAAGATAGGAISAALPWGAWGSLLARLLGPRGGASALATLLILGTAVPLNAGNTVRALLPPIPSPMLGPSPFLGAIVHAAIAILGLAALGPPRRPRR